MKRKILTGIMVVSLMGATLIGCTSEDFAVLTPDKVTADESKNGDTEGSSEDNSQNNNEQDKEDNAENQDDSKDPSEDKANEEKITVYVSLDGLSLRNMPTLSGSGVLATLKKGQAVTVLEEIKDAKEDILWYKIDFEGAPEGDKYLSSKYTVKTLEEVTKTTQNPQSTSKGEQFLALNKGLNFSAVEKKEYPNNPRVQSKGIFLTRSSAQNPKKVDELIALAKRTGVNTFVIDVKDDDGKTLFPSETANRINPNANSHSQTMEYVQELTKKLKENNIYIIARVVSFKDPSYAKAYPDKIITYKDSGEAFINSKVRWVPAYDRDLWKYNIEVSKEAAKLGFNEIQFDYVRFPASNGGKLDTILDYKNHLEETKAEAIQKFLIEARKELSPLGVYIAADVFGLVPSVSDDMGIGQYWEAISNVVDYISTMAYPSHYANGTYGIPVPNANPYKTIYECTIDGIERNKNIENPAILRTWIQDFSMHGIKYGPKEVEDQIKALKDAGAPEYLLWNAGNKYTEGGIK